MMATRRGFYWTRSRKTQMVQMKTSGHRSFDQISKAVGCPTAGEARAKYHEIKYAD